MGYALKMDLQSEGVIKVQHLWVMETASRRTRKSLQRKGTFQKSLEEQYCFVVIGSKPDSRDNTARAQLCYTAGVCEAGEVSS